jgi:GTP-binding protein
MRQSPPAVGGRRCAMKYITQVGILPPTFAVFANIPQAVPAGYKRYLARQLRGAFGFEGVPVRLLFRGPQPSRSQHGSGRRSSG